MGYIRKEWGKTRLDHNPDTKKIDSIWQESLETFRERVAYPEPMPAGVAVSAVTAALATGLMQKVLAIMAKRKRLADHASAELSSLGPAAEMAGVRLKEFADADIAAYNAYLQAHQRGAGEEELARCQRELIEVPLQSARSAVTALELCATAAPLIQGAVLADLATAALLLSGAIHGMLLCLAANLVKDGDPGISSLCQQIESRATRSLEDVLQAHRRNP